MASQPYKKLDTRVLADQLKLKKTQMLALSKEVNNELITEIQTFAEAYKNLNPSQLRKIYDEVRKTGYQQLPLTRPKLAYLLGKSEKGNIRDLVEVLDEYIKEVKTQEQKEGLDTFLEAFVAYHKYYNKLGGNK